MAEIISLIFSNQTTNQTIQDQTYHFDLSIAGTVDETVFVTAAQLQAAGIPGVPNDAEIKVTFVAATGETTVELLSDWNDVKNVDVSSTGSQNITLKNFVHTDVELGGAGPSEITIEDAKRGTLTSGDGDDVLNINAYSNGGWDNSFNVDTGAGNDIVNVDVANNGQTIVDLLAGDGNDVITITGDSEDILDGGESPGYNEWRHPNPLAEV